MRKTRKVRNGPWTFHHTCDANGRDYSCYSDPAADIPENMFVLRQPVLLISGSDDPIVLSSVAEQTMRPYASNLTVQEVKAGHWVQLQAKDQTNKALEDFFKKVLDK